jgi:hypothetical protein
MRLKVLSIAATCLAVTAASPAVAGATVRPQLTACNSTLEMWPNTTGGISVAGGIQITCGGPWTLPYLVIYRVGAGGALTEVAAGVGGATYQCQGTAWNDYEMGGEIPNGLSFNSYYSCG